MFAKLTLSNEIIGLALMLLLAMALIASQVDATIEDEIQAVTTMQQSDDWAANHPPLRATVHAHINGKVLTVSIDTMVRFGLFRLENK
jgi:hypothetical protein